MRNPVLFLALLATAFAPPLTGAPAARSTSSAAVIDPELSHPFVHHTEGYACFRIPALVATADGTLLAFAEGRVADCADVGDIDLVLKRSTDEGRTWGPLTVLRGRDSPDGFGNPAPVVDSGTGRVSVLFAHNPWTARGADRVRGTRTLHALHSTDDGASWTPGGDLGALKPAGWTWISVGPGHGVQLRRGKHAGRLIVPGDYDTSDGGAGAQLYYSDDGGLTWRLGARYETERVLTNPGELTVAERADGTIYINSRSSTTCGTDNHRLTAVSEDGGETFTAAGFQPVPDIDAPPVSGSLLALRPDRLLLSAPARPGAEAFDDRRVMAVRTSTDEGRTWRRVGTVITEDRAGYSDLTRLASGGIGLLYETNTNSPHGTLTFSAFSEADLDAQAGDLFLPRTPDASGLGNHAVVHGGTRPAADAERGEVLPFDGQQDHLRLINCPDSLRLGATDFTVTAWVNGAGGPVFLGPGDRPGERGLWLRLDPAGGHFTAGIDTGEAAAEVSTGPGHGDGAWHHVVLTRRAGELALSADGGPPVTAPAPAGEITPAGAFTFHIGGSPDGAGLFTGALDDVRVLGRALTAGEADRVRAGESGIGDERVRLPFAALWPG
ncbi:sialidase family protein [Streptomyces litchfieldiae]|uniref:exo-alpha-sialidase n=1 Tax=Streptomyces litchfieldiae TaxID=3075543 RepID=A0ABU2MIC8_9ACTN|nr:sialidase family protein [Streptomyces sp. DSM 44938]MDT0341347.1 sialidase family protein [Streptomyces sp. DSM 44938]